MILVVGSNKGGSGKTTLATNLAVALSQKPLKTCLVDADPQGSAMYWSGVRDRADAPSIGTMMRRGNLVDPLRVLDQQHQVVIVDVPGRNSQELLSAAIVADVLIAPHACSQLDLETLQELEEQVRHVRQINPKLRVLIYQALATTNPALRKRERADFRDYVGAFEGFELARSIGYQRLVYRECISAGTGVVETANSHAANEISLLVSEVLHG
ncbi:AAA family ATPase [Pseudomonas sp. L-22-4S-12]|uniref:AAA family ATPase n=1 Tax=Pseudomonas sp. L-22-4S-12 TaxID=2610893 RepID=UPI001328D006|nr:AAA family ATPase [Pseudomonas sp. L-22-4S-12]MWV17052.1 AAA family ATPase [Pseudomonas sp. L-22-4S-12]